MQQPRGTDFKWVGTDFKWGGRAPLASPLATALHGPLRHVVSYCVKRSMIESVAVLPQV